MNGATGMESVNGESQGEIISIRGSGPIITLPPDPRYRAYYVLEDQLRLITDSGSSYHLSFASIAIGVFCTAVTTLMAGNLYPTHPRFFIFCLLLAIVSGSITPVSTILWFRSHRRVEAVINALKSQYKE